MARQWILNSQNGFENSLEYRKDIRIPSSSDLGPKDVLVKMLAASLNYRDLMIATPGTIAGPIQPPLIPGCDGAGIVEAIGSSVQDFRPGDRVVTYLAPKLVESSGNDAVPTAADTFAMLGCGISGTLRSHAVFPEAALVPAPRSLDWLPASTLTCTWTTAWNALFGLKGKQVSPGSWVLVQGTGGVSIAALQLAVAAGANVVATTSTADKSARLVALGAAHTINYVSNPTSWGTEARKHTPGGRGFDIIIDVGGDETLPQSLAAARADGLLMVIGGVGDSKAEPVPLLAALIHTCIVRGILGGTRTQFYDLVKFIDEKDIKPTVDEAVFELAEAKDAYRRLSEKKHFSKVVIRIDH
ncbi:putative alcohol dehydrogenase [Xylaria bambusicola]|uniref:putative alcohol dehydrogenase n=1 Tax=Xylaria bambusicola TaxID=326684 RepID=UPI002007F5F6|nr:putative alcohol dehydrogenase [Xylaria bambusicola]KAI0502851.1 putative alcohol dehydrogenase [Xylaria bambusicola]